MKKIHLKTSKPIIFSDFDGTITTKDTLVTVFDNFCREDWRKIEERFEQGDINQIVSLSEETKLLDGTLDDFFSHIKNNVAAREGFFDFYDYATSANIPFFILSSGYVTFIKYFFSMLKREDIMKNVFANDLSFENGSWKFIEIDSPKINMKDAHCKFYHIEKARKQNYSPIIYIGDGITDRNASMGSDLVFARGSLKSYLKKNKKDFFAFESFEEIKNALIFS